MTPTLVVLALVGLWQTQVEASSLAEVSDLGASLGAHQHGVAQLQWVVEQQQLQLALVSPAINLLGFEHAPQTAAEQEQWRSSQAFLAQADWLDLSKAAGCKLLAPASFSVSPLAEAEHSQLNLVWRFSCVQPQAISQLDLSPLFKRFPNLTELQWQRLSERGQSAQSLSASQPLVMLP